MSPTSSQGWTTTASRLSATTRPSSCAPPNASAPYATPAPASFPATTRTCSAPVRSPRARRLSDRARLARSELDDRDRPVRLGRFPAVRRVGREDAVGQPPEALALGLVGNNTCPHRDAAEADLGFGLEVVEPGRVLGQTEFRGDDRDLVAVVEVDDHVAPRRAALRALGLE